MADLRTFTATDGYRFYYRHYPAAGEVKGRVIFVHGIRSHGGWYDRSCSRIAEAGYDIYFLDRRGSGLNTAHRGDCPSFRRLLDDVAEFIHDLRRTKPWLPVAIAGISWGGKLAAGLPYRAPGLVDAVALLCPGFCPQIRPPLWERALIGWSRFRRPLMLFNIPLNDAELFTTSQQWRRFIEEDRHGLLKATGRFLYSSFSFDIYLKRAVSRCRVPSLLMLAGEDRIIINDATKTLFKNFGTDRRTVIEYPGAHHTLEFESDAHPFVDDLVKWLQDALDC